MASKGNNKKPRKRLVLLAAVWLGLGAGAAAAAEGDVGEAWETCVRCHEGIGTELGKAVIHAAVAMGCETCHIDHRSSDSKPAAVGAEVPPSYLNDSQPALCWTCHDAEDAAIVAAHGSLPFQKAKCTGCHNPHASDSPKLMPAVEHGPFAARGCTACHVEDAEAPASTTVASGDELCLGCHAELQERIETSPEVHSLLKMGGNSCLDCHSPHAAERKALLLNSERELCGACHAEMVADKKFPHEPVRLGCGTCHDPHASEHPAHLVAEINPLCMECHGERAPELAQTREGVELFDGKVSVEPGFFTGLKWIRLNEDGVTGHPNLKHPVLYEGEDGRKVNCVSCHKPHGSRGSRRMLVTDHPNSSRLCVNCH